MNTRIFWNGLIALQKDQVFKEVGQLSTNRLRSSSRKTGEENCGNFLVDQFRWISWPTISELPGSSIISETTINKTPIISDILTILTERETVLLSSPTTRRAMPTKSIRKYQKPIRFPTSFYYLLR